MLSTRALLKAVAKVDFGPLYVQYLSKLQNMTDTNFAVGSRQVDKTLNWP